jgi:hypothetical protein
VYWGILTFLYATKSVITDKKKEKRKEITKYKYKYHQKYMTPRIRA